MDVTIIDVFVARLLLPSTWLLREYFCYRRGCCETIAIIDVGRDYCIVDIDVAVTIIDVVVAGLWPSSTWLVYGCNYHRRGCCRAVAIIAVVVAGLLPSSTCRPYSTVRPFRSAGSKRVRR